MSSLSHQLATLLQTDSVPMSDAWGKLYDELKRIDEARAKPIGEVVAWGENIPPRQGDDRSVDFRWLNFDAAPGTKLYAHPPARTEQQLDQIERHCLASREVVETEEDQSYGFQRESTPLLNIGVSLTPKYATLAYQVNGGWTIKKLSIYGNADIAITEIAGEMATLPCMANLVFASSGISRYVAHCLANLCLPVKAINFGGEPRETSGDYRFMDYRAKGYCMMMNESEKLYPVFGTVNVNRHHIIIASHGSKLVAKSLETLREELPDHHMILEAMALYYVGPDAAKIDPVRPKCNVCDTELVDDIKKLNFDCGGTCLKCMAEWGDEECARAVSKISGFSEQTFGA